MTAPRVVVGVDGSEQSVGALRWAARLADALGASLVAVLAWQHPVDYGWSPVPLDWNAEPDMEKVLTDTVDAAFGADRPAGLELDVARGHAAQVLREWSTAATVLVVGSRGHGGFAGLLLGSVSASVAEHAHCPVLIARPDQRSGEPAAPAGARSSGYSGPR
jgi:nucleotide-binding universal stress UspA family protein